MESLSQKKKIIYIAAGAVALTLLGFLAYRFLLAPAGEPSGTTGGGITGGRLPEIPGTSGVSGDGEPSLFTKIESLEAGDDIEVAPEKLLTRLTDYPVISPSLNPADDKILFYKKDGGDLMSLNFDGTGEDKVSNVTIVGLIEALWAETRDRAGVFYLDGDTRKGFLYLGEAGVSLLPQDIKSFSWSPDGKSLAYLVQKNFQLDLVTADSSGKNPRTVFSTPLLDSSIKWISPDKIAFQTAPSAFADGFIFVYSRSSGSFTRTAGPMRGLMSLWSPDGARALTVGRTRSGVAISQIIRSGGETEEEISFTSALPEKCTWSGNKKIYCALHRGILSGIVMPDQYLRGEINTLDQIISYDLDAKEMQTIFSEGAFDISDLRVSRDEKYFFFVSRRDGTLWSLKIR